MVSGMWLILVHYFQFHVSGTRISRFISVSQEATDPLEKAVLDGRQLALKVSAICLLMHFDEISFDEQQIVVKDLLR